MKLIMQLLRESATPIPTPDVIDPLLLTDWDGFSVERQERFIFVDMHDPRGYFLVKLAGMEHYWPAHN